MNKTKKHFSQAERQKLKDLLDKGFTKKQIAQALNKSERTIYNELAKNKNPETGDYDPAFAQENHQKIQSDRKHWQKLEENKELAARIAAMILKENLSPEAASKKINEESPEHISVKTIYNAIDKGLLPGVSRDTLHGIVRLRNNDTIQLPKHIINEIGMSKEDVFTVIAVDKNTIVLQRKI